MKNQMMNDDLIRYVKERSLLNYKRANTPKYLWPWYLFYQGSGIKRGKNCALKILPFIHKKNLEIMDFGSGIGLVSYGLSTVLKGKITGLELYKESLDIARDWVGKFSVPKITFKCKDINDLSQNKKFDLIIANDVLEHVPDRIMFLKLFKKHLRKNGLIYIRTTNRACPLNFLLDVHFVLPFVGILDKKNRNKLVSIITNRKVGGVFDYSFKRELEQLFEKSGFLIVKDFRSGFIRRFFLAHEYLVRSKK